MQFLPARAARESAQGAREGRGFSSAGSGVEVSADAERCERGELVAQENFEAAAAAECERYGAHACADVTHFCPAGHPSLGRTVVTPQVCPRLRAAARMLALPRHAGPLHRPCTDLRPVCCYQGPRSGVLGTWCGDTMGLSTFTPAELA
jgi:hypothetical protein